MTPAPFGVRFPVPHAEADGCDPQQVWPVWLVTSACSGLSAGVGVWEDCMMALAPFCMRCGFRHADAGASRALQVWLAESRGERENDFYELCL